MSFQVGQRVWVVGYWHDQPVLLHTTIRSVLQDRDGRCQYEVASRHELQSRSIFDDEAEASSAFAYEIEQHKERVKP